MRFTVQVITTAAQRTFYRDAAIPILPVGSPVGTENFTRPVREYIGDLDGEKAECVLAPFRVHNKETLDEIAKTILGDGWSEE